jgi:hypothetical protein
MKISLLEALPIRNITQKVTTLYFSALFMNAVREANALRITEGHLYHKALGTGGGLL